MFRFPLTILLFLLVATVTFADENRATVHPWLTSLVEAPADDLPDRLRGSLGGFQGRHRLGDAEALDLHVRTTATREALDAIEGVRVRTLRAGWATVTVRPRALRTLALRPDVTQISLPRLYDTSLDQAVQYSDITPLRSQVGGVWSGKTGAGVVVGVIDSGIDLDHVNFQDANGNTRIAHLWDQSEDDPSRYPKYWSYGTEWTAADIDAGISTQEDDPDSWGHGTHVAGIAAGNGAAVDADGNPYVFAGVAPAATLIFVKVNWTSTGIVDGLEYIFEKADELGMPAVVNLSLGSTLGSHDGTSSEELAIDSLVTAQDGRAVVVAAGNSRADDLHAEAHAVQGVKVSGPSFEVPSYSANPGAGSDYILIAGYYSSTDDIEIYVATPWGMTYIQPLNTVSVLAGGSPCSSLYTGVEGAIQICNHFTPTLDMATNDREILIYIYDADPAQPPATGTWQIDVKGISVAGDGNVDFRMISSLGSDSAVFTSHVEEARTLIMPATSHEAITVGAYASKLCWDDSLGNPQTFPVDQDFGDIAYFSSAGPTRDGRAKPEIAAPGLGIVSAMADEVAAVVAGQIVVTNDYSFLQGTSMAAPMVTGAVALLLEEDPTYSNAELKDLLKENTRHDEFTFLYEENLTRFHPEENYSFGDGKLDFGGQGWVDPYEANDQRGTARPIISGEIIEGYLETPYDLDFFVLPDLQDGDTVNAELTSLPADYRLILSESTPIDDCGKTEGLWREISNAAGLTDESLSFTLTATEEPRHLRIDSLLGFMDTTDSYHMKAVITRPETSAIHSSIALAHGLPKFKELVVAGTNGGLGERDVYAVELGYGAELNAGDKSQFWTQIEILDANGAVLASGADLATWTNPGWPTTVYVVVEQVALGLVVPPLVSYDLELSIN